MNTLNPVRVYAAAPASANLVRAGIVLLVVLLHVAFFAAGWQRGITQPEAEQTLSISFNLQPVAVAPVLKQPVRQKQFVSENDKTISPAVTEAHAPVAAPATISKAADAVATAPVAMTEPDYKAAYLNNPAPVYPLAARRMGMQGKVLLHVEVLASGVSGQVDIQQSSGYPVLDTAALQAVKAWRFAPATQAGRAVDKWFMIPVQFSLREQAA